MVIVMMSKWIFENENIPVISTYPKSRWESRAPPEPPRHHDRATPTPHISRRCPRRNNCRRCPTRRAGAVERRPPGDRSLPLREGGGSARTEGLTAYSEAFWDCRFYTKFKIKSFPVRTNFKINIFTLKATYIFQKAEKKSKKWISKTSVRFEKE